MHGKARGVLHRLEAGKEMRAPKSGVYPCVSACSVPYARVKVEILHAVVLTKHPTEMTAHTDDRSVQHTLHRASPTLKFDHGVAKCSDIQEQLRPQWLPYSKASQCGLWSQHTLQHAQR